MPEKTANNSVVRKIVVVLALVGGSAWLALNQFRATAFVAIVKRDAAVDIVSGSVVVRADGNLKELKSEQKGRVVWCEALDTGKAFKKGDELVRLDTTDVMREMKKTEDTYNAAVEKAKITKAKDPRRQVAEQTLNNAKREHDLGGLSDEALRVAQRALDKIETDLALEDFELKQKKTDFETAKAEAKLTLEKMTIRAPVDGIVQEGSIYLGALISEGATVARYYSTERIVEAKISEDSSNKLAIGQRAKIRLLNLGSAEFDAKVIKILPFADAETQRYTAYLGEVALPPEKLIPFSTGEVTITVAEHPNQPLVPRRAVFSGKDGSYVLVVKDGRVEKRKVTMGFPGLNKAEIKAGLEQGEQVITDDLDQFNDGDRVRVSVITGEW